MRTNGDSPVFPRRGGELTDGGLLLVAAGPSDAGNFIRDDGRLPWREPFEQPRRLGVGQAMQYHSGLMKMGYCHGKRRKSGCRPLSTFAAADLRLDQPYSPAKLRLRRP